MIPVHQTILADPARNDGHDANGQPGNCYQAAIASALDLRLDDVPHFATFCDDWVERSLDWFASPFPHAIPFCFSVDYFNDVAASLR